MRSFDVASRQQQAQAQFTMYGPYTKQHVLRKVTNVIKSCSWYLYIINAKLIFQHKVYDYLEVKLVTRYKKFRSFTVKRKKDTTTLPNFVLSPLNVKKTLALTVKQW